MKATSFAAFLYTLHLVRCCSNELTTAMGSCCAIMRYLLQRSVSNHSRSVFDVFPSHRVTSCEMSFLTYYLIQLIYSLLQSILICKEDIDNSWKDFHILSIFTQNTTIMFLTRAGDQLFPTLPVFSCNKDFSHTLWLFQNLHTPTHPFELCCNHLLM